MWNQTAGCSFLIATGGDNKVEKSNPRSEKREEKVRSKQVLLRAKRTEVAHRKNVW
ncbi:MAG: hypothetical protein OEW62_05185 [Candidatus Bathyarchaeota archaeon]|nr:hypothetical protein [Candidatus Bathyarchaeota archaeon]